MLYICELIAGFIFYKKEKRILEDKNKRTSFFMGIKLIQSSKILKSKRLDSNLKIIFLMFIATLFDFYDTILFYFFYLIYMMTFQVH